MEATTNKEKIEDLVLKTKTLRNFNTEYYIEKKVNAINNFFDSNNLDSAVLGLSGGVDSAVVYALLSEASKQPGSPIKFVVGLAMPIYGHGTTNQVEALKRASLLTPFCTNKIRFKEVNLTKSYEAYIESCMGNSNSWAKGQLASIVRTPALYYQASLLQQEGMKSIVVGTTNRDEGSYIGFFGKASDAMVDLQPIADIHKSEVYKVAKYLGVHQDIINAKPSGDVWDGRVDEDMIGAPYWILEMYLLMKEYGLSETDYSVLYDDLYYDYLANIRELHNTNAHKYKVGSPAQFIDVMNRHIPGGW